MQCTLLTDKAINVTKERKKHVASSLGNKQYNNNKWSKRGTVVSKNFLNTTFQLSRAACETNTSDLWEEYLRGILKKSSINTKIRRNGSYATNKKWLSRTQQLHRNNWGLKHDHQKQIWVKKINKRRKEIKTRETCND